MSQANLLTTLAVQFKASPGKAGLLCFLAVVLLVMGVRLLTSGPSTASATMTPEFDEFDMELMPDEASVSACAPRLPLPDLPEEPSRNLFKADRSLFAKAPWADHHVEQNEEENSSEEKPSVLSLKLTLTAPLDGGRPYAVINGRSVRVGDVIDGFVVESISPGKVVLSGSGQERTVLRMD